MGKPYLVPCLLVLIGGAICLYPRLAGGPADAPSSDDAAVAFDRYETLWRDAQSALAEKLKSGEIKSEKDAGKWFAAANSAAMGIAFKPLLEQEADAFGGEQWTAEKHAEYIRRYADAR
jgi:hypothetical protein